MKEIPEASIGERPILYRRQSTDIETLAKELPGRGIEYRQLDSGRGPSEVLCVAAGNVIFAATCFQATTEHQGCVPPDYVMLAFGPGNTDTGRFRGKTVSRTFVAYCPPDSEFSAVTPTGLSLSNLLVPVDDWEAACADWATTEMSRLSASRGGLNVASEALRRLGCWNEQIMREAKRTSPNLDSLVRKIGECGPALLVRAFCQGRAESSRPSYTSRYRALRRAKDYITAELSEVVRTGDVAFAAGVSERTLEYAFREEYGLTPKAYISARRLQLARQRLLRNDPNPVAISVVAMDCGFNHLGRFTQSYKKMFGEVPSETLKTRRRSVVAGIDGVRLD